MGLLDLDRKQSEDATSGGVAGNTAEPKNHEQALEYSIYVGTAGDTVKGPDGIFRRGSGKNLVQ